MNVKLLKKPLILAFRNARKSNFQCQLIQRTFLSTNIPVHKPDDKNDKDAEKLPKDGILTKAMNFVEKNSRNVLIGTSVVVGLTFTRTLYGLTHSLLTLTPYQAVYYGFVGGILATGTTAGILYYGERAYHINPNRAVAAAMKIIYENPELKAILGTGITASQIKTYASTYGGFGIRKSFPTWVHPGIEAAFMVSGSTGEAMVTAVYVKKGLFGKEIIEYVGLEWIDKNTGNSVTSTLKGDSNKFTIKNTLRPHGTYLSKKYFQNRD